MLVAIFLYMCALLKLHRYGLKHPDAFKEFLTEHQCYAEKRVIDKITGRKYTHYRCQLEVDDIDLYDMPRGPGEN